MQHLIHGSRWNPTSRFMLDPVPEDVARSRYQAGESMVVAAAPEPLLGIDPETYDGPDGEEPATWSLHTQISHDPTDTRGFLEITFFNLWGLKEAWYWFMRSDDGHLFLQDVHEFDYADPTDAGSSWSQWRQFTFRPDGYSKELVTEMRPDRSQNIQLTEYTGGDFSSHVEPVPAFGQWAGVLKRQR